jgi:DNA-binding GntR family transcriptional regulator
MAELALAPVRERPVNLTEIVFFRIRDAIVNRTIAPGSRVSESTLASMLQVSKTPVRESLLRLCHIGLVEQSGRGMRVVAPSRKAIHDAYEFRSGVERLSAELAAERASSKDREEICVVAQQSLDCAVRGDRSGFAECDEAFHLAVAEASANRSVHQSVEDVLTLTNVLRARDAATSTSSVKCATQHTAIAAAVMAGERVNAGLRMQEHVYSVMDVVVSAIAEQADAGSQSDDHQS